MVRKLEWWFYPLCFFFSFRHRSLFLLSNFVAFLRTKKCIWYRRRNLVCSFSFEKLPGVIYHFLCNLKFKLGYLEISKCIYFLNIMIICRLILQFYNTIFQISCMNKVFGIRNRNYQIYSIQESKN